MLKGLNKLGEGVRGLGVSMRQGFRRRGNVRCGLGLGESKDDSYLHLRSLEIAKAIISALYG